jgi:ABC-type enterobactin transport system permease subunit
VRDPKTKPTKKERERAADIAHRESATAFVIRRRLDRPTALTAAGVGAAVGLVTAYLTSIWLARAPLEAPLEPAPPRGRPRA